MTMPGRRRGRGPHKGGIAQETASSMLNHSSYNDQSTSTRGRKGNSANPFSMRDTAENTEHRSWVSSQQLRHSKISFIGSSENACLGREGPGNTNLPTTSTAHLPAVFHSLPDSSLRAHSPLHEDQCVRNEKIMKVGIFTNTLGAQTLKGTEPPSSTTILSEPDSGEEVIVFEGRKRQQTLLAPRSKMPEEHFTSPISANSSMANGGNVPTKEVANTSSQRGKHKSYPGTRSNSSDPHHRLHNDEIRPFPRSKRSTEYEDIIIDHAENCKTHDMSLDSPIRVQSLQYKNIRSEEEFVDTVSERFVVKPSASQPDETKHKNLQILGTSNVAGDHGLQIMSKRDRRCDVQHLVAREGEVVDAPSWASLIQLITPEAREATETYECAEATEDVLTSEHGSTQDTSDIEKLAMEDVAEDMQDLIDSEGAFDRAIEGMTHSQIARLLSKQEELGLGSDELMIFDGLDFGLIGRTKASKRIFHGRRTDSVLPKSGRAQKSMTLNGVAQEIPLAGPYGDFDIMDFERPSLQRKTNGRKGAPPPITDEELDKAMQNAWNNDRAKKKLRKEVREEVRRQGLLGKKSDTNMTSNYREGITASQLKVEIRSFLLSNYESLSLPPMDKGLRRLVHEIANRLSLRSKSSGLGHQRYPQLYKTSLTEAFDELSVQDINHLLVHGSRHRQRAPGVRKNFITSHKARGSTSAAVYRDGEVVGAEAPELGLENKGRAMLEKMGWSKGTALGALNNKGILQPVLHVVKTTKAGLG